MVREIVVKVWCDLHLARDEHAEAVEFEVTVQQQPPGQPATGPLLLALCEVHRKELLDPFAEALAEHGQPVAAPGSPRSTPRASAPPSRPVDDRSQEVACPACGFVSLNRRSLATHVRSRHGQSLSALAGAPAAFECPDCGMRSVNAQGAGAHRQKRHGWRSVDHPGEPVYVYVDEDGTRTPMGKRRTGGSSSETAPVGPQVRIYDDEDDDPTLLDGSG